MLYTMACLKSALSDFGQAFLSDDQIDHFILFEESFVFTDDIISFS